MYLENSEQTDISGERELSTEAMLAEQCQVPKLTEAADLNDASKGSAELGIRVLVEYTEQLKSRKMDFSLLCDEQCNMTRDEIETFTYCNGHAESFEQYSASNGFFESDQTIDHCETLRLSQQFDECAQHCECFKPCKSSEHCANHSLTSTCNSCCEHCVEHLQLFQQCKPPDQQFESFDIEPDKPVMNGDNLEQCEMSDLIPESTDHFEVLQQYEPTDEQCECFDCEPDTSTEHSEHSEMTGFTPDISDSVDLLDCGTEFCEYDDIQNEVATNANDYDYDDDDDYSENCPLEQNETEASDDESCRLSEDVSSSSCNTPVHIYYDDNEHVCLFDERCEDYLQTNEQQAATLDVSTDHCETCGNDDTETNQECEPTQQCSDKTSEFGTEEECSSDCSSMETKSFTTCPDGSIPSDHYSDSSRESDKGVQEDSSDDQTEWESFEEDEQTEQIKINESNEEEKKTPTGDIVIEDYFDFFDRTDYYRDKFSQKRHYISCFDGGDIHDCLHLEEKPQKCSAKNAHGFEKITVHEADVCSDAPEEASQITSEEDESLRGDSETEKNPEDWSIDSESGLADDDIEEIERESCADDYEEAEEDADGETFDEEACVFDGDVCEICHEDEAEVFSSSGNEESMCAPCADNISVEGDAYEDEGYDALDNESLGDNTSSTDQLQTTVIDCKKDNEPGAEDTTFIECSEIEAYWLLKDNEYNIGERCESDVEEYYACQIRSIQSSGKQALNEFMMQGQSYDQIIHGNTNGDASRSEREGALFPLEELETEGVCPEESKTGSFRNTEVGELAENLASYCDVENATDEQTQNSDDELKEVLRKIAPPVGIIHSVVSEHAKIAGRDAKTEEIEDNEQSSDSEEEQSDNESFEPCECEHCVPLIEQVSNVFTPYKY